MIWLKNLIEVWIVYQIMYSSVSTIIFLFKTMAFKEQNIETNLKKHPD